MILDSSAIVAILKQEPDFERYRDALRTTEPKVMSVANWVEVCLVFDNQSAAHAARLDQFLEAAGIELVPVSIEQARVAREAYRRFGRGSGSPAKLNYGDCFAYALAITTGDTLLYKGDDFAHTDIRSAL